MATLLLLVIYTIFISLGLPDSVLGSSFPAIAENLQISSDQAGYIGLVVSCCTILSSLFADRLVARFHTKRVISYSILLTILGLVGFSFVRQGYAFLFYIFAIPLGLGAGCIDSALNNYVSLHYKAIHMNWLHCCWGVGASISPFIISSFIDSSNHSEGWNRGIFVIAIVQLGICILSFLSFPLWKKIETGEKKKEETDEVKTSSFFRNPVFYLSLLGFFCYCGMETTLGNWGGSYFCYAIGFDTKTAAFLDSLFYLGITLGRFFCGPLSLKVKEKNMMRIGEGFLALGCLLSLLRINQATSIAGYLLLGLGCAPIYPAIIRSTVYRFSKKASLKMISMEMAIAYLGNVTISPLFGFLARTVDDFSILMYFALILLLLMVLSHEVINRKLISRDKRLTPEEKKEYESI